jgi:hypothetical protein
VLVALTIFGLLWSNYHWVTDILGSLCWCGAWLLLLRHFGVRNTKIDHGATDHARDHANA